jgi:hypothetical protein
MGCVSQDRTAESLLQIAANQGTVDEPGGSHSLDFRGRVPSIGANMVSQCDGGRVAAPGRPRAPDSSRSGRTRGLLVILTAAVAAGWAGETAVQRARYLFDNRHLDSGYTLRAWQVLADYRSKAASDTAALALWCQVNVELGDDSPRKSEQEHYYQIAEVAADTLRTTCPNSAAGHFWWAAAHGDRALAQGIPEVLLAAPSVIREMERAIDLDPAFPLPYAVLGMLYRDLPTVVGGDWSRSRRYLEDGLEQAPNLTLLRLELARLDVKEGLFGEARDQLGVLLSTEYPYFESAFVLNDRPEAESLLAQIRGK